MGNCEGTEKHHLAVFTVACEESKPGNRVGCVFMGLLQHLLWALISLDASFSAWLTGGLSPPAILEDVAAREL